MLRRRFGFVFLCPHCSPVWHKANNVRYIANKYIRQQFKFSDIHSLCACALQTTQHYNYSVYLSTTHTHSHRSSDTFLAKLPAFKHSKSTFCNLTQLFSWSDRNSCYNHFIILARALQQVWYVCYNTVADKGMDDPNGVWKFFPTQFYAMPVIAQTQDQGTQVTKLAATITTLMDSCIVNFTAAKIHRSVGKIYEMVWNAWKLSGQRVCVRTD